MGGETGCQSCGSIGRPEVRGETGWRVHCMACGESWPIERPTVSASSAFDELREAGGKAWNAESWGEGDPPKPTPGPATKAVIEALKSASDRLADNDALRICVTDGGWGSSLLRVSVARAFIKEQEGGG